MKKGFTLTELLAVIVILVIILAIAIPKIMSIVDNAKINSFISNENMVLRATKNYIGLNEDKLPVNIGDTIEITLSELQSENYVGVIKNFTSSGEDCNGYVLVSKISEFHYDYIPHIKCNSYNQIDNLETDGLLMHYKMNAINQKLGDELVVNGNFDIDSNWNKGVCWTINNGIATCDGTQASFSSITQFIPTEIGKTYKISFDINSVNAGLLNLWLPSDYLVRSNLSALGNHSYLKTAAANNERLHLEGRPDFNGSVDNVSVKEISVMDSTPNNNHGIISNASLAEDRFGNKNNAYSFNGTGSINTGHILTWDHTNQVSISFWMSPNNVTDTNRGIIGKNFSSYAWSIYQHGNSIRFVYWNSSGGHTNGMDFSTESVLSAGQWVHVSYTWDGIESKFYINGNLEATRVAVNPSINRQNTSPVMIGGNIYTWADTYFRGKLSDVRFYARLLSDYEVKQIYNVEKRSSR